MNILAMILSVAIQIGMALVMFAAPDGARDGFNPYGLFDVNRHCCLDDRPTRVFLQIEGMGFASLNRDPVVNYDPPVLLQLAHEPKLVSVEPPLIVLEMDFSKAIHCLSPEDFHASTGKGATR